MSPQQQTASSSKVQEFKAYIKNAHIVLEKVGKVSEQMEHARKKFNEKYTNLLEGLLPNYQLKSISQYTDNPENLWFMNQKENGILEAIHSLKKHQQRNALLIANELIKEEIRELDGFSEIIKHKDEYERF